MMRAIWNTRLLIALVAILILAEGSGAADQDLKELAERPSDSAQAANLRVWLALERSSNCRIEVTIYDSEDKPVRKFLDQVLRPGYLNFYWDKLDDSGRWVPEGDYYYLTNDCGGSRKGKLRAEYRPGENSAHLRTKEYAATGSFEYELLADSSLVTLEICNRLGKLLYTPIKDSLMAGATYSKVWTTDPKLVRQNHLIRLEVNGFVHEKMLMGKR